MGRLFKRTLSPPEEITLGEESRRIMESPALLRAFDQLRDELEQMWLKAGDIQGRETAYFARFAVDALQQRLESYIETGEAAQRRSRATQEG